MRSSFLLLLSPVAAWAAGIDFVRDVRPILATHCYDCHGEQKPKGGLRLTSRESALKGGKSETPAFVPGKGATSELIIRVCSTDRDEQMPPKGKRLSAEEIATLERWIDAGAHWPENVRHWAYQRPVRAALPEVTAKNWPRNAIDRFVLAALEKEKLQPSPEADRAVLLRRVSLDLIGLPPSPAEVDAFLADTSSQAYERAVDRLLASPQFGERWARPWLDLARYADSHGFQRDDLRDVWPYRDWVVRALNADMPFDQFTVEQLAGDLLPNATQDQVIATGFNRCTPTNVEAGTEPEESRVNQVFDRVNTLGAVWLGTTLECAQCHDHKFDPFTMRDYYRFFAYFNQTAPEAERAKANVPGSIRFIGPYRGLEDAEREAERAPLLAEQGRLKAAISGREKQLLAEADAWETRLATDAKGSAKAHVLDVAEFDSAAGLAHRILEDKSVLLSDDNVPATDTYTVTVRSPLSAITGIKLEALTDPSLPGSGPGRGDATRPNFVLNEFSVTAAPAAGSGKPIPVHFRHATASFAQQGFDVVKLLGPRTKNRRDAWAINPQFHKPHWALFECAEPIGFEGGTTLTFKLVQEFGGGRMIGRLRLTAFTGPISAEPVPADLAKILAKPKAERTAADRKKLAEYQLARDREITRLREDLRKTEQKLASLKLPQTLVMQELEQPRLSTMFNRGVYTDRGEPVEAGTPAILHAAPGEQRTRLDLARWLVSRENPLVARVTVNRWWAELFGRGLVGTVEDFGIKGEAPTHPELLDWLACEFMEGGWSMKRLLRTIVTSATYRQSSKVTPALLARDDQNKLLARGPRHRLDAEMIRDNALAIAGLLSLKQGGPPIRPPQPDGLWSKVGGQKYEYVVSPGEDKYRRGLYVVLKRAAPYPSFVTFDATARMACTVKRSRSNTPLQALTLLNDPVYVEAAQAFARRITADLPAASLEERLGYAFKTALARTPRDSELQLLTQLFADQKAVSTEAAAWQAVATALLNLDETINKN